MSASGHPHPGHGSLRSRILTLSLLSSGAALLLAFGGFAVYEFFESRNGMREKLQALAVVVADNSAAALAFHDKRAAADVLASLHSVPEFVQAALYDMDGLPFAAHPPLAASPAPEPRPFAAGVRFGFGEVEVRQPVRLRSAVIGQLLIRGDLHGLYARLAWKGASSLLLIAVVIAISTLLLGAQRRRIVAAEAALDDLTRTLEERVALRTAELESANRELESFSYSVSHDLRSPLRAMAGFAGILREDHAGELSPDALRSLERIEENAVRMGRLVDDLLELSRTGRTTLTPTRVDMRTLAHKAVQELGEAAAGVEVRIDALPPCRGDAVLLGQVWANLVGNACKFARHAKPPRIEISGVAGEDWTEYAVADNGAGFEMQYVGKLFRPFERLHLQHEFEGTGIGLAIVQRIIQRHGGEVHAEGAPGKGATIRFRLRARG